MSKRPFKKTESQEHLEVFKANKFKNLLKTALNKKLIDTLQEEIVSSKAPSNAGSARGHDSLDRIPESSNSDKAVLSGETGEERNTEPWEDKPHA